MAKTKRKKRGPSFKTICKRIRFAQNYILRGMTMSEALRAAGWSPKNYMAAWKALLDPGIRMYIVRVLNEQQEQLGEIYRVDKESIINELAKIAFSDPRRIARVKDGKLQVADSDEITNVEAAAINEIHEGPKGLRIKFHNKVEALDKLAKILGLYVEKHEHTGKDGEPLRILFNVPRPCKHDLKRSEDDGTE